MIKEMLYKLNGSLDDDMNSISSVYTVPWFNMIPLTHPQYPLRKWDRGENQIPCMNIDCEWIQHMSLFYRNYDLFLLPGLAPDGYCMICHMIRDGTVTRDTMKMSGVGEVIVDP